MATFHAPPLSPGDPRAERVYEVLESTLAVTLRGPTGPDHEVAAALAKGRLAERGAGTEASWLRILGLQSPSADGPISRVLLELSPSPPMGPHAAPLFDALAETLSAYWAMFSPSAAATLVADQVRHPGAQGSPPHGLPWIRKSRDLPREVPHRLGWLNYWSDAAAARIGFSDSAEDRAAVAETRRLAHGWAVTLTREPLDVQRPEHLAALRAAYQRFPAIGQLPGERGFAPA